jgi:predicted nuclease of predicted toxin-antitoxin system
MKLLLDQNLSFRLINMISESFSDVTHVSDHQLINTSDKKIWDYAKNNQLIILSKDSDFHQFSFLYGHPPKVIWIKHPNCSTLAIAQLLIKHKSNIEKFAQDSVNSFLVLE